ncbi:RNA metabolism protein [Lithospermum erythrorhizon]|uniref:RNA metabolism protein n=1 Tax=Lithospermum erythrorhizon TaxID=34254 RepID=A0AAV3PX74_LITER
MMAEGPWSLARRPWVLEKWVPESVLDKKGVKLVPLFTHLIKFRAGVCPYITNCNFAHTLEELRKPPPNWQEIVASHEGERSSSLTVEPREEHQIPTIDSPDSRLESQRSFKGRHCKKFYTEEGCPYGESCTFLHDEQSRTRESVAISVTPTVAAEFPNTVNGQTLKPS